MKSKHLLLPLFILGLTIKLLLIGYMTPSPVIDWYSPFMITSIKGLSLDPWTHWLELGGDSAAFPYGYVMWIFFFPGFYVGELFSIPGNYSYGFSLLILDLSVFIALLNVFSREKIKIILHYWLSPIIIVACYLLGYNDLVPVSLLAMSLYFMKKIRIFYSGFFLIVAISAKLSMALALPFFIVYFAKNKSIKEYSSPFLKGAILAAALFLAPFVFYSDNGVEMLVSTPEIDVIYEVAFSLGDLVSIYLVPLMYGLLLYATWRVRRLNFNLFFAMFCLAFLLVVLVSPAPLGWYVWVVPLLLAYQLQGDKFSLALTVCFSFTFLFIGSLESGLLNSSDIISNEAALLKVRSLLATFIFGTGLLIAIRFRRENVRRNDYFRLSQRPFVMGIAGDSGSGKDTYSNALKGLFGSHSVTAISGDDYHLWDRQKPIWQAMTHLNPMANDLERFASNVISLTDSKSVMSRHYNHSTGKMSKLFKVESNDFILVSGLHALYLPILRECYNLSVYLDIHEGLRRHFKIQRDVKQRGHTEEKVLNSIESRMQDAKEFVHPQINDADLVLSLQPVNEDMLQHNDDDHPIRYKLSVRSRQGLNELSLIRVLVGVCGLHVDVTSRRSSNDIEMMIEGESSAEDIAMAARMICPKIFEFLDINPMWEDGVLGLMQLVTLSHINQAFNKRFI
ncbi:Phosphoribulokinase [Vibrio nigripulchritudo MADA3029]|uniref:phosphoribulokinase n=1 Tax=Vibrio nigripulchritudo TaxID=28173 RepID=UPI0003B1BB71|nr:phosphoribulokinase [Vibrio nigripulchritudo]CCN47651.1 Phosphoribulokinase [Vibrio nigripulchritudo MADA3020]CCN56527.1 Phosphoribulokinase [Vibrio nigripulchritudo MADA3021]CCN58850.1 Phosphoribulokinase [Vibrio nigripulchritudo MADA3029]